MSIFDTAEQWPDEWKACGAPHQSPVNLSQSFALPCDRLCEWKVDDTSVGTATVESDNGGMVLTDFSRGKPTATFNGDGYTCSRMRLFSTSQHSLEGVFGEAELVVEFTHPTGKTVCMSVIVRSTPGDSPSSKFFNGFVPYFTEGHATTVTLSESWSLQDVIPDTPSYYIYTGSALTPPCEPDITWIVYSNTVSMDPSDYAKLVRHIKPARRPLEEVGDREVTFFDAQGVSTPRDGKLYMRCRRVPKAGKEETGKSAAVVQPGGLNDAVSQSTQDAARVAENNALFAAFVFYEAMGGIYGVIAVLVLVLVGGILFFTSAGKKVGAVAFVVALIIPHYIRAIVIWLISLVFAM